MGLLVVSMPMIMKMMMNTACKFCPTPNYPQGWVAQRKNQFRPFYISQSTLHSFILHITITSLPNFTQLTVKKSPGWPWHWQSGKMGTGGLINQGADTHHSYEVPTGWWLESGWYMLSMILDKDKDASNTQLRLYFLITRISNLRYVIFSNKKDHQNFAGKKIPS